MKRILFIAMLFCIQVTFAETNFSATLIKNGTYLSIRITDDHLIPPFEAGELWKLINSNEQLKIIREKDLSLDCNGLTNQSSDVVAECSITMPFSQFEKIGKIMVFKASGQQAARLNRYFVDSAFYSAQGNQVYLTSYNTRRLFFFGINEDLIH